MNNSMIAQAVERLFTQNVDHACRAKAERGEFPEELWRLVEESGFTRALVAEDVAAMGESWQDAYPILRGIGYWQVPLPLAETMVAAQLLAMAGIDIPDGPITLIEHLADSQSCNDSRVDGPRITGSARHVPWARHSRWALVSLHGKQLALVDLRDRSSVQMHHCADHAGMPIDDVSFQGVKPLCWWENALPALEHPVRTLGAMAYSVMMVGALESLLAQCVSYANDRVQFGRPIGANQAIQQQLALMAGDVAAARIASLVAVQDAPYVGGGQAAVTCFSAAVAKVRTGEAAGRCAAIAHQVHGALGYTKEHSLHRATTRLWAWREAFGSETHWARHLGMQAISAGSAGFWSAVTGRSFASDTRRTCA